jgi:hypothetical protein
VARVVFGIFQKAQGNVVGSRFLVGDFGELGAIEREDLALGIGENDRRLRGDDELNIGIS